MVEFIKAKKWGEVRDWMFAHTYIHPKQIERELYKSLQPHLSNNGKVACRLAFGEYSHKIMQGADPISP